MVILRVKRNVLIPLYICFQPQAAGEIIEAFRKGTERRYDIRLVFIGHFGAGKTTLIKRLRKIRFDMKETKSTNCIVVITKGGINMEDGEWIDIGEIDEEDLVKRMKYAKEGINEMLEEKGKVELSKQYKASHDAMKIKEVKTDGQPVCRIYLWDFAGQSVFNSVHQMFMSYRAIYAIVFDISKPLEFEIKDDDFFCLGFERRMNVQDFCIFLLQSVHMYHGQEKNMFPKVLLVGTHKDEVDEDIAKQRMETLKKEISKCAALQKHVVGDFLVNNSDPDEPEFQNIKQIIFRIANGEPTWGETTPASWMPLEKDIFERRNSGTRLLTLKEIKNINEQCYLPLESDDAIYAFLKFQNALGNMIFFGKNDPNDLVILQPQWLIDSVKQIITHEQFYIRPAGLDKPWEEFTQCAKLHINLIEAIWSENSDKTFINHKNKVFELLEFTDIFCSPKVYNKEGDSGKVDYVFVPSMFKPNQDGIYLLEKTLEMCKSKSPTLCFVFKENFMPPAIFPRVQAACTKEYNLQQVAGKYSLFYQCAIFQLDSNHELILEQFKHIIRVNIVSFTKSNISSDVCEVSLTFLEDILKHITSLYHAGPVQNVLFRETGDQDEGKREPSYYKAIQCPRAENKVDALFPLADHSTIGEGTCRKHKPDKWHELNISELKAVWQKDRSVIKEHLPPLPDSRTGDAISGDATSSKLSERYIGRLARQISSKDLRFAAHKVYEKYYFDNLEIEHQGNAVDFNFSLLWKWATDKKDGITLKEIKSALVEVDNCYSKKDFLQGISDKDYEEHFQDIDASFLDRPLDDATIDQISQRTGKECQQLAIELGVSLPDIERTVIENSKVVDRTRGLIRHWKSYCEEPTFRQVAKAIIEVNMDISIIKDCYIERKKRENNLQEPEQRQILDCCIESEEHAGNLQEPEQGKATDYYIESEERVENLQEQGQGEATDYYIESKERVENLQEQGQGEATDYYIESKERVENLQEQGQGEATDYYIESKERVENLQEQGQGEATDYFIVSEERVENLQEPVQGQLLDCYIEHEERAGNLQELEQGKATDYYIESEGRAGNLQEPVQGQILDCYIEHEERAGNLKEPEQGKATDYYIESKGRAGNLQEPVQGKATDYYIESEERVENLQEHGQGKATSYYIESEERVENLQEQGQGKATGYYIESAERAGNLQEQGQGKGTDYYIEREERVENLQEQGQGKATDYYIESEERVENLQEPVQGQILDCYIEHEERAGNLQEQGQGKVTDCYIESEERVENLQEPVQGQILDCYIEHEERAGNLQEQEQGKAADFYIEREERAENIQESEQENLIGCNIESEDHAEIVQEPGQGKKAKGKTKKCCLIS